ncbi:hypothetical protein [Pseudomonas oligotrophica]|uniref:hypothetical protein n=1 Tax=Pseudomonas oligotrophica TaxID=2912055 RepID=UPI003D740FF5
MASIASSVMLCASAAEPPQLSSDESARYLAELRQLYLTNSDRQALLAHGNSLLETYALRAGYQVGRGDARDYLYRLELGEAGELRIREEVRGPGAAVAVRHRSLAVYGLDPYLQYRCPDQQLACSIDSPLDGEPLVRILRDPKGAQELAKALSFLIRNLQKG